jgi:hypothetical protein
MLAFSTASTTIDAFLCAYAGLLLEHSLSYNVYL